MQAEAPETEAKPCTVFSPSLLIPPLSVLTAVTESVTIRPGRWCVEADMAFTVRCPHCDTLLKVPDKYHYQVIPCPKCKNEIEAISQETVEVGEKFLEELENLEGDMIIDESHPGPPKHRKPGTAGKSPGGEDLPRLKKP
jgi:phage FluMu protein Com